MTRLMRNFPLISQRNRRLCLCLLLASMLSSNVRANEAIQLVSAEYPPYFGASLPHGGPVTQIIKQAWKRGGYAVNVKFLPWARALTEARNGSYDGIIALPHNQQGAENLLFSLPLLTLQIGFFKQRDQQIEFHDIAELKAYKIGVVRGHLLPPEILAAKLLTFESLDDASNLRKLALGRVDLALGEKAVGNYFLENRLTDMRIPLNWQGQVIASPTQHLAMSRNRSGYEQKMHAFNEGLRQMQQDGSLRAMLRQAGLE